jgi:hypothetical protein
MKSYRDADKQPGKKIIIKLHLSSPPFFSSSDTVAVSRPINDEDA